MWLAKYLTRQKKRRAPRVCQSCGGFYELMPIEVSFYLGSELPMPTSCRLCRAEEKAKLQAAQLSTESAESFERAERRVANSW